MSNYYEQQAERFFRNTVDVDMDDLYTPFLAELPPASRILDAGCGSGRDSRAFLRRGYRVDAFDASRRMARLASAHIGQSVHVLRFDQLIWQNRFDGIWACASLLHVPWAELPDALQGLARALKPGGVLYASFKYGSGERYDGGRHFTDMNARRLARLLEQAPGLSLKQHWISTDRRPEKQDQRWLNVLLTRADQRPIAAST